jgi:hypothetical protein
MQAKNASHKSAVVYEITKYMILLRYEHQTYQANITSLKRTLLSEMHDPVKIKTLPNDKSDKKYEHFQIINQT